MNKIDEIWKKIGLIINISQMIEYSLINIIAVNEILSEFEKKNQMYVFEYNELVKKSNELSDIFETKTFGEILSYFKEIKYFKNKDYHKLIEVLKRRNYVVHKFFKDDLSKNNLETNPTVYYSYLDETIKLMNEVNDELVGIDQKQRNELDSFIKES